MIIGVHRSFIPILALACVAAYLPAFNNGFIADDYVILEWAGKFIVQPSFLFTVAPQNFRMTSYLVFEFLKRTFGYQPAIFYAVNVAFHFIACVLLWRLLRRLTDDFTAGLAGLLFAVFQAPQEAVMWLAAMNETLSAIFILATLLLWTKNKHGWGLLCYTLALISKESAPILLFLIPVVQWRQRKPLFTRAYLLYFIPTAAFAALFLMTSGMNHMIVSQNYAIGTKAVFVLLKTFHRLCWPWLYAALLIAVIGGRLRPDLHTVASVVGLIALPMLPYIFLTYDTHLPSRQLYLASMVAVTVIAMLVQQVKSVQMEKIFIALFILINVGHLWMVEDKQFEARAAPTTQLLQLLRTHEPTKISIHDFPYPVTDIAQDVSFLAPGWTRDMITVDGTCTGCITLKWSSATKRYQGNWE